MAAGDQGSWPDAKVKKLQHEEPTWVMSPTDAADLG